MKKLLSIIFIALLTTIAFAQSQDYTTINVTTPGTLKSILDANGEKFIFYMKVTGNIDARDIKCLRDNNPVLAFLDLSEATINEYYGAGGTAYAQSYAANVLPDASFYNYMGTTSSLIKVILPPAITSINGTAFKNCPLLTDITIPNYVTYIGKEAFYGCHALSSIIISNSVIRIGTSAFLSLSGLKDLTIGNSVSFMGDEAIFGCTKLETITFLGITPPEFESNRFFYLSSLENIYVPAASVAAYKASKIADLFYSKIKANPTDDITSINSGVKVYASGSAILVEGIAAREIITLYSISGKQLKTVVSTGERLTMPVDKQGIYLVKIGGKTYKVMVAPSPSR